MHVDAVGDEVDRATRIGQDRLDSSDRPHARIGFLGQGKHVVEMRGVAGAGVDRRLGLLDRRPSVRDERDDPRSHSRSITGRMFGTSGLIDIAATLPPAAANNSSSSPTSPAMVCAPAPARARNGPSRCRPGMQTSSTERQRGSQSLQFSRCSADVIVR